MATVPLAGAPAAAEDTVQQAGSSSGQSHATRAPGATAGQGSDRRSRRPEFGVTVNQRLHSRSGGYGVVDIRLARSANQKGRKARDVKVLLYGPRGTKVVRAQTLVPREAKWKCRKTREKLPILKRSAAAASTVSSEAGQAVVRSISLSKKKPAQKRPTVRKVKVEALRCTWPRSVRAERIPAQLRAWVTTGPKIKRSKIPVQAVASWRAKGAKIKRIGGRGTLKVDRKLGVRLSADSKYATYFGDKRYQRTGVLTAKLLRHGNRDVSVGWEQIGGPRVKFPQDHTGVHAKNLVAQRFVMPRRIADGDKLRFRVKAVSNGQIARSKLTLKVRRNEILRMKSRMGHVASLLNQQPTGNPRGFPVPAGLADVVGGADLPCSFVVSDVCNLFPSGSTANVGVSNVSLDQVAGTLSATVAVISGEKACVFDGKGTYTSRTDWSLAVTSGSCAVGSVTLSGMSGSVGVSDGELTVSITGGTVTGVSIPSITLNNKGLSVVITNGCYENQKDCDPSDVNIGIKVDGSMTFNGDQVAVSVVAPIDLSTGTVGSVDASASFPSFPATSIGPVELGVEAASVTLTIDKDAGACYAAGTAPPAPTEAVTLKLSVSATPTVSPVNADDPVNENLVWGWGFASDIRPTVRGSINSDGYCLWIEPGETSALEFDFSGVVLGFTSYEGGATVQLPDNPDTGESAGTVNLKSGLGLSVQGYLQLTSTEKLTKPPTMKFLFSGSLDEGTGFTLKFGQDFSPGIPWTGQLDDDDNAVDTALVWDGWMAILSINLANYYVSMAVDVDTTLVQPMKGGSLCPTDPYQPSDACSYTPLAGQIMWDATAHAATQKAHGWSYTETSLSASLRVNTSPEAETKPSLSDCPSTVYGTNPDDAKQVPLDPQPQCVNNAFATPGLDVAALAVGVKISWNGPWEPGHMAKGEVPSAPPTYLPPPLQLAIQAQAAVFLPDGWTKNVALVNQPLVTMALSLQVGAGAGSLMGSCLEFSVGAEPTDPSQDPQQYFDLANTGAITGSYLYILLAPTGCTFTVGETPQTINSGMALAFDAQVLGDPVIGHLDIETPSGTENVTPQNDYHIHGDLSVGAFGFEGVSMKNLTFSVDFWQGTYTEPNTLLFNGGLGLGWGKVLTADVNLSGYVSMYQPTLSQMQGYLLISPVYTLVVGGNGSLDAADGLITGGISGGVCPTSQPFWNDIPDPKPSDCILSVHIDAYTAYVGVDATVSMGLLGTSVTYGVGLIYADNNLMDLHADEVMTLDLWIGSVTGGVFVDYCHGNLTIEDQGQTAVKDCAYGISAPTTTFNIEFGDGNYTLGWCPFCYSKDFGPYTIYSSVTDNSTGNTTNAGGPQLNTDLNLKNPGSYDSLPASAYDLSVLLRNADTVATADTAAPDGTQTGVKTMAIKGVAPEAFALGGAIPIPACESPATGTSWQAGADGSNPAVTNTVPFPKDTVYCGIEVIYSVLQAGNPTSGDEAQSYLSNTAAWGAPQKGYAACGYKLPGTQNSGAAGGCVLQDDSNNDFAGLLGRGYLSDSGDPTYDANAVFAQVSYGTTHPIGVVLGGMELAPQSLLSAPGGDTVLQGFADGHFQLQAAQQGVPLASGIYWATSPGGNSPLRVSTDGVLSNGAWASPEPSNAPKGLPYLQVGSGGAWVQNPDDIAAPFYSFIPPGGSFRLRSGTNPGMCLTPALAPLSSDTAPVLAPCGSAATQIMQYTDDPNVDGVGQFSYLGEDYNGAPDDQWCLIGSGGYVTMQNFVYSGVRSGSCGQARADWSFPGDGTVRLYEQDDTCLDVQNGGAAAGTTIQVYGCNGTNAQSWTVEPVVDRPPSGSFQLQSGVGQAMCLEAAGSRQQAQIDTCQDVDQQTLTFVPNPQQPDQGRLYFGTDEGMCLLAQGDFSGGVVVSADSNVCGSNGDFSQENVVWRFADDGTLRSGFDDNMCLDVTRSGTSPGTPVQIYGCNGTGAQQWSPQTLAATVT